MNVSEKMHTAFLEGPITFNCDSKVKEKKMS